MKLDRAQLRVHALGIILIVPCCIASVSRSDSLYADSTPRAPSCFDFQLALLETRWAAPAATHWSLDVVAGYVIVIIVTYLYYYSYC